MTDEIEPPLYQVIEPEAAFVNGRLCKHGETIQLDGWPPRTVEAVNESAKRIVAYHRERQAQSFFPRSPWNSQLKTYLLPAVLLGLAPEMRVQSAFELPGSKLHSPPSDPQPTMPRYKAVPREMPAKRGQDGPTMRTISRVGRYELQPGESFAYLGWPTPDMAPDNSPARKVAAYHAEHKENAAMLPSPWCLLRGGLFLPDLPKQRVLPLGVASELQQRAPSISTGRDELPPYSRPDMAHVFATSTGSRVNTAKPFVPKPWRT